MITIQAANKDDINTIVEFQLNMALETEELSLDPTIVKRGVEALFQDPNKGSYYVAKDQGLTVACLMTTPEWSEWRNGNVLWIQSVYVRPSHRGKGVFRQLYTHIQELVEKQADLRGIRLYVDKSNTDAQKVYDAIGMDNQHYQLYEWMK